MRVLGLCSYPVESAATRYRLVQYVEPLASFGIELDVKPFLTSDQFGGLYEKGKKISKAAGMIVPTIKRFVGTLGSRRYDLLFVQREAMLFGPPVIESLYRSFGNTPMVLDLDDATYIPYNSPTYGRLGSTLKFFGKTDSLIKNSRAVVCGNSNIAKYVSRFNIRSVEISTIVDNSLFVPIERTNPDPVIGWIGTHSTFRFLSALIPILERLSREYKFTLKLIGSGRDEVRIEGVRVENLPWKLETEISDFQSIDIGLYPIFPDSDYSNEWLEGKSGFKAIQYMAVGIPFVMSPVGVGSTIGSNGKTHLNAPNLESWYTSLSRLLESKKLRAELGSNGRQYSLENFSLDEHSKKLSDLFKEVTVLRS